MIDQKNLKQFTELYDETYHDVLKYVVCHSYNINDVNDIVQETYLELYKIISKRSVDSSKITAFIKGIAKNKIKKQYSLLYKLQTLSIFSTNYKDIQLIETLENSINLDEIVIEKEMYSKIWEYVKTKRSIISKIFFLYYSQDLSIKEISKCLKLSESYIKNCLYRTVKELQEIFGRDSD